MLVKLSKSKDEEIIGVDLRLGGGFLHNKVLGNIKLLYSV